MSPYSGFEVNHLANHFHIILPPKIWQNSATAKCFIETEVDKSKLDVFSLKDYVFNILIKYYYQKLCEEMSKFLLTNK